MPNITLFRNNRPQIAGIRSFRLPKDSDAEAHNFLDSANADSSNANDGRDFGGLSLDENDDDDDGADEDERQQQRSLRTPDFVTVGQKYSVAIGATIVLPCKINDSGELGLKR